MANTQIKMTQPRKRFHAAFATAALLALVACGDPNNAPLPGERETLSLSAAALDTVLENSKAPISLRAPQALASWTHPGGNAAHNAGHATFGGAPNQVWSVNIGAGDGRRQRINASPIVADGRIFTIDAKGIVAATNTAGERLWTVNLTPSNERIGQGGSHGLSYGGGLVYVLTGFGELVALDPATGGEAWTQDLDAQGGASATYFDGRVYVAARDSVGWAIDAETGRVQWQVTGTPSGAGYLGGAGPAVTSQTAVFPFSSGELVATFRQGGVQRWNATVRGGRTGVAYAQIADVVAAPVVAGDRIYVANPGGRLIALEMGNGDRVWTAREGALSAPVVAGGSVFLMSDQNALVRLDAATGERIWAQQFGLFEEGRARRQKTIVAHYGPVLAGGRLWIATSEGVLQGHDPVSGALVASGEIPGGAATAPVIAGGVMYVVSKRGQLIAFR